MIIEFKLFEKNKNEKLYTIGTKVICIRSEGTGLIEGEEYEIENINSGGFNLNHYEINGGYYVVNRFLTQLDIDAKKYNL